MSVAGKSKAALPEDTAGERGTTIAQEGIQSELQHVSHMADTNVPEDQLSCSVRGPDARKRTPTEKGLQFQIECAGQSYQSECKKIRRQHALVNELLEAGGSLEMVRQEIANLDRRLSEAETVHSRLISLIPEENHVEQQDKHDAIDQLVFEVKKRACSFLKANDGSSASSRSHSRRSRSRSGSHDSKHSRRSKVSTISRVESLKVEEEALEQTQKAKTEELECLLKLEKAKMETERTRLQQRIIKAQMEEGLYQRSDKDERPLQEDQLTLQCPQQESRSKISKATKKKMSTRNSQQGAVQELEAKDLTKIMVKLTELHMSHSAPSVDIEVFSGNPLEYSYFRAAFHEVVEKKILEPRGRLTRLLKYTTGEANELIKHCIHEKGDICFDQAIELLEKEFGNPQILINSYLKELRSWPSIKSNDAKGYKKFHRFLRSGLTHRRGGRLKELDSESVIRASILAKFDKAVQEKWLSRVVCAREKGTKELDFSDRSEEHTSTPVTCQNRVFGVFL